MKTPITLPGGRTVEAEVVPFTGGTLAVYQDENPSWARNWAQPRFYWYIAHVVHGLVIARMAKEEDATTLARQIYGRLPAEAWKEAPAERLNDLIDREVGNELTWLRAH
jgi:hypothetical protein